ncbi:hypothetical protein VN12_14605 [Pirellula sp. SH-Sr6A]|uniref:hypothetical protein n=1 Tax=Pirellula sp. SH-Sr6A TaxID=1632865 RepID=UPI00078D8826|nr:hypothetical protein [Pirellula sp. SH-Sr6A]AMV33354.1 hypothetical protein VN12_14605 [Pirellula sp. SH-Sr6A]
MADPIQVEKYRNDAALTLRHLPEVLAFLVDTNEETAGYAVEALENCGVPPLDAWAHLAESLNAPHTLQVYWAATLIGRMVEEHRETIPGEMLGEIERALGGRTATIDDMAAKERIVWAITKLPAIDSATRRALESCAESGSERLKRWIEEALSKA